MAQEKQDVEALKRRGRRRLVGAVALVLAAVIVLPMVFDPEPRGTAPAVNVRIPGEDETPFAPKPPPRKSREEFVVQVGAFSSPQAAIAKLESVKIPYFTEKMHDNLTRVRAGPFATREAAEKALEELKKLGFEPGAVGTKSG
jgi:cell division septation protein DedD